MYKKGKGANIKFIEDLCPVSPLPELGPFSPFPGCASGKTCRAGCPSHTQTV